MTEPLLPYGRQEISDADLNAVRQALQRDFITQGPLVEEFESAFAGHVGATHAVAFSSGTAALHAAAHAADLGPGDELITSPLSFVASANCALFVGATPRFADVDPDTWNIAAQAVADAVTPATKAVVAVSLAGLPVDLRAIRQAAPHLTIIEDACHALGGVRDGTAVGGAPGADMTVFSFHPVKTITTGEGGMVTTESGPLAARLRRFRSHGVERSDLDPAAVDGPWYYEVRELGYNYRITDFQCALGLSQLGRLDDWAQRRNEIARCYRELLAGETQIALPPAAPTGWRHGHHLFVIRVLGGAADRRRVFEGLRQAGIGVQVHYIPIYRFPLYREQLGYPQDACPQAETYYGGAISLPMFPAMDQADVERVARELSRLLQ